MPIRKFALVLLAVCLAGAKASTAADQVYKLPFTFTIPFSLSCSYGDLQGTETFTGFAIHHLDANSNIVGFHSHEVVTTTFVNPLNGKMATGSGPENDTFKWVNGQETQQITRGITVGVEVPGVGQFRFAGRIIYDFSNGFAIAFQTPKVNPTPEFTNTLCSALQ